MKVLILGSQGFIGQHLAQHFLKKGHDVTGCDLLEHSGHGYQYKKISLLSPDIDLLFGSSAFDVCINASGSGNVSYSIMYPNSDFEANVLAVVRVLDCIRRFNSECKYIHISSAAVYGNPSTLPVAETALLHPLSPYGWHKWMSEMTCTEYTSLYGVKTCIVRPFSIFGPLLKKQLLWDIYLKLKNVETQLELWGTGRETRDFIYIDDFVKAIALIVAKGEMGAEVYNLSSGQETCISKIAELMVTNLKRNVRVKFNGVQKQGDPLYWKADIKKLVDLGFASEISVEEGVKKYVQWLNTLSNER